MKQNLREEATSYQNKFEQALNQNNDLNKVQKYNLLSDVINFIQLSIKPFEINQNNYNNAVFLMGPTGAGKSTLMNYLAGNDLYYKMYNDKPGIFPEQHKSVALVGQGKGSTTLAPNIWVPDNDDFPDTTFIDCAGEFDSSGVVVEIINEKIKSIIAKNVGHAKILIVSSQNSIGPSGAYGVLFKKGLESSAQFLNDFNHFEDSTAFIISHAGRNKTTTQTVKSYLQTVIENDKVKKYKKTLEKILNQDKFSTFSTFSDEIDVGEKYEAPRWNPNQKKKLINLINDIEFKNVPQNFFNIASSAEVKEQMTKAFLLVRNQASSILKESIEDMVNKKIVVQATKLRDFVDFIEHDLIEKSQGMTLNNYVKFISNSKFIKISPPEEIKTLHEQINFIWPYTQNINLQSDGPKINWNACVKYNILMKDVLDEAKSIIYNSNQLFNAFHEKTKIKTVGCFDNSEDIKHEMDDLEQELSIKKNIIDKKHSNFYQKNVTESQFDRMISKSYSEREPYTVKETYTEKVIKLVDTPVKVCVDTVWAKNMSGLDNVRSKGYIYTGNGYSKGFWNDRYRECKKYEMQMKKTPKEFIEQKQRDVIKYKNVTKYKNVPSYKNVTVKKFDADKFNSDLLEVDNEINTITIRIKKLLSNADNLNIHLKSTIDLKIAQQLMQKQKEKADFDYGANSPYNELNQLMTHWKSLEYENCVLNDHINETNLAGDLVDNVDNL